MLKTAFWHHDQSRTQGSPGWVCCRTAYAAGAYVVVPQATCTQILCGRQAKERACPEFQLSDASCGFPWVISGYRFPQAGNLKWCTGSVILSKIRRKKKIKCLSFSISSLRITVPSLWGCREIREKIKVNCMGQGGPWFRTQTPGTYGLNVEATL